MTNSLKSVLVLSLVLTGLLSFSSHSFAASSNVVEVTYQEEGRFLALVPVHMTVSVRAYADGKVEVKYPWYSFLTVNKHTQVETETKVAVDNALRSRMVGSVQAEGKVENPSFTAAESTDVALAIQEVLKASVDGSVTVGVR